MRIVRFLLAFLSQPIQPVGPDSDGTTGAGPDVIDAFTVLFLTPA